MGMTTQTTEKAMDFDTTRRIACRICFQLEVVSYNAADMEAWINGTLIQNAFPYLTASQREMIQTQTCSQCWDAMFADEDEELEEIV